MLTKQRPVIAERLALTQATDFVIDNPNGRIEIFENDGNELILTAEHEGELPMKVSLEKSREKSSAGHIAVTVMDVKDGTEPPAANDAHASNGGLVSRGGGVVMIDGKVVSAAPGGGLFVGGGRVVRLKLQVPAKWARHIRATSRNGELALHGKVAGPFSQGRQVTLTSQNGNIVCDGISSAAGQFHLISHNGQIKSSGNDGRMFIETNNGNVLAQNNRGDIDAKSVNGDVTVIAQSGGRVYAATTNGDVLLNNPNASKESASAKHGEVKGLTKSSDANADSRSLGRVTED